MRFHVGEGADLGQVDVFPVAQCHDLIEGKQKLEAMLVYFFFFNGFAILGNLNLFLKFSYKPTKIFKIINFSTDNSGKESQSFQVFQYVACFGCDEQHVELVDGLVDVAHTLGLDECVLLAAGAN